MKKHLLIITALTLITVSQSVGQPLRKRGHSNLTKPSFSFPSLRSSQGASVGIPIIYTNEAAFLAAIGSDYFLDNYPDCVSGGMTDSLFRNSGAYNYVMTVTALDSLYNLNNGISTLYTLDSILITNTGKAIRGFGGYFYNTNENLAFASGDMRITVGDYSHTFTPADSLTFIGFVFTNPISSFYIANTSASLWVSLDHLYMADASTPASIKNVSKATTIYPNPTSDGIYVNATGTVSIFSADGQKILSNKISGNTYLPLTNLQKGVYVVEIETKAGISQEKLIKK